MRNYSASFINRRRRLPVGLFLTGMFLASASGCGTKAESHVPVSGVVYCEGHELSSGIVRFVPISGTDGPIVIAPVVDGEFSLTAADGPGAGTYRVEVHPGNFLGFDPGDQAAAELALRSPVKQRPRNPVPPGYDESSPLIAEIPSEGIDGLVFLLTDHRRASTRRTFSTATNLAVAR